MNKRSHAGGLPEQYRDAREPTPSSGIAIFFEKRELKGAKMFGSDE